MLAEPLASDRNRSTDILEEVTEVASAPSPEPFVAIVEPLGAAAAEPVAPTAEAVAEPSSRPAGRGEAEDAENEPYSGAEDAENEPYSVGATDPLRAAESFDITGSGVAPAPFASEGGGRDVQLDSD